jgi:methylated-DNA-[protein]-cysteine S-methyltransferase
MDQAAHFYLIFETAAGFCGIAWNSVGVMRFQLPTRGPEATKLILLRRAPGAKPGAPTPEVAEAIAAVKRYFEGEQTDFCAVKVDLGAQDPFFERIYEAARRVGWGRTTTYGALAKDWAPGRKPRAMSVKPWPATRWR